MLSPEEFVLADHAFSPVVTREVMLVPFGTRGRHVIGWPVYLAGSGAPDVTTQLKGRSYVRVTALPEQAFAELVAQNPRVRRLSGLGRICEVEFQDDDQWVSTRDPALLAREEALVGFLAQQLNVASEDIGFSGSLHYRSRDSVNDVDFVIYGHAASCRAERAVCRVRATPEHQLEKFGVTYQSNFRFPGSDTWFDPRYIRPET